METLTNLAIGYSVKETARILDISPKTIENHLARIKDKTECKRSGIIIRKIIELGLIKELIN